MASAKLFDSLMTLKQYVNSPLRSDSGLLNYAITLCSRFHSKLEDSAGILKQISDEFMEQL